MSALGLALGCANSLDVLGVEENVKETQETIKDDVLSEKHPEFDPDLTIEEEFSGCRFTLNKSASVTRLSISPLEGADAPLAGRLFPDRAAALAALEARPTIPSMEVVNGALKPFNDGLYAAVELAAEDGSGGSLVNKRQLLDGVLAELLRRGEEGTAAEQPLAAEAAEHFAGAVTLSGGAPTLPAAVATGAEQRVKDFRADVLRSQPIGFYTWTPELERIFTRDRFLQDSEPSLGAMAALGVALNGAPALLTEYGRALDLYDGLTNPPWDISPREILPFAPDATALADLPGINAALVAARPAFAEPSPCNARLALLPASDAPENALVRNMVCSGAAVDSSSLLDLIVAKIQSGELDLTPRPGSGWYDHQLHALETLLAPERAPENEHLLLTKEYKEKLVETFKSLLIQTRETHAKQVGMITTLDSAEIEPVDVYPLLPVEPFPTFYLRTARAYSFVQGVLGAVMGQDFLSTTARLREDGSRAALPLAEELADKARLCYGLHAVSAASIGIRDQLSDEERAAVDLARATADARQWLAAWRDDVDVRRDPRVALPVAREANSGVVSYWGVVGVKAIRMHASFPAGFEPKVVSSDCPLRAFVPNEPYMLVEQVLEFRRPDASVPFTREEFRAICDQHSDLESLRAALEAG